MDLTDRIEWLLLGCAIGFVLGYIVRSLHEIKEELDEVDDIVKRAREDESGIARHPILLDIALLLVVLITAWAAFSSQMAANKVEETQDDLRRVTKCNGSYLGKTIQALNTRTQYSTRQIRANVRLQNAQARFFRAAFNQQATGEAQMEAVQTYVSALNNFLEVSEKAGEFQPYPTREDLDNCINQ